MPVHDSIFSRSLTSATKKDIIKAPTFAGAKIHLLCKAYCITPTFTPYLDASFL